MRLISLLAASVILAGCTTAYWGRPGATLPALAEESQACYHAALAAEAPRGALLPGTEPPPKLWELAPRQAGFARLDEQLRYQRCMTARGWEARRSPSGAR
jgi:hypothetical protein